MADTHREERQQGLSEILAALSLSSTNTEPNSNREPIFGSQEARKSRLKPPSQALKRGGRKKEEYTRGSYEEELEALEALVGNRGKDSVAQRCGQ